jgi:energy-converting hydrogenase B subunit D
MNDATLMLWLQGSILVGVAVVATIVVLTRDPLKQVIGFTFYGLVLTLMFFVFQAPDVALSEIVVGAVVVPLMVLLTLSKLKVKAQTEDK